MKPRSTRRILPGPWKLALSACLLLSGCPNYYSEDFVKSLDQAYYSKWPLELRQSGYSSQSLAAGIMPYFREHARACGLFANLNLPLPPDRDYIPPEIQEYTGTPLGTPIAAIPEVMGENIFYYGFPDLDPARLPRKLEFQSLFEVNEAGLAQTYGLSRDYPVVPEKGVESWRIRQDCGGFLNSHLASSYDSQSAPPLIPYGAFKAAVQNDREMKSSLVAVSGRFNSPLGQLLASDEISPDAINVKLNLWYKYRAAASQGNLAALLESTRLLREFRGLLISRATSKTSIDELNANGVVTLDLKAVGASAESKLDARYSVRNTFESNRYETLIYCQGQNEDQPTDCQLKTQSLPAPEQLVAGFARINPETGTDAFSSIQPNRTLRFWQDVAGIPAKYCNKAENRWELAFNENGELFGKTAPSLGLAPLPLGSDGIQKCRFTVEGRLRKDLDMAKLANESERVAFGFELINRDSLSYAGKQYQLRIPAKVSFGIGNLIQPLYVGKEPLGYEKVGSDPHNSTLKWEFDIVLREQEGSQIVDYAKIVNAKGLHSTLSRFSENRYQLVGEDLLDVKARVDADGRKFLHVEVRNSKRFDLSDPSSYYDEQHTLRTELQIPLSNRDTETVPIEIRVAYPVSKSVAGSKPEQSEPSASPATTSQKPASVRIARQ